MPLKERDGDRGGARRGESARHGADGVFQKAWCEEFRNLITSVSITTAALPTLQGRRTRGDKDLFARGLYV